MGAPMKKAKKKPDAEKNTDPTEWDLRFDPPEGYTVDSMSWEDAPGGNLLVRLARNSGGQTITYCQPPGKDSCQIHFDGIFKILK